MIPDECANQRQQDDRRRHTFPRERAAHAGWGRAVTFAILTFGGLAAGFLAGLFGLGGGLIMVPVLVYAFNSLGVAAPHIVLLAIGTSMAAIVFSTAQSAYGYFRRGTACGATVHRVAPWAIVGVLLGSMLAGHASRSQLLVFVAGFQFFAGALILVDVSRFAIVRRIAGQAAALDVFSVAFGGIAAMAGIGGGTLFTPYFVASGMEPRRAVGTSVAIGVPVSLAGAFAYAWEGRDVPLGHWTVGYIHLPALCALVAGMMLTVRLGVAAGHSLPPRVLLLAFVAFVIANGTHLLHFASE